MARLVIFSSYSSRTMGMARTYGFFGKDITRVIIVDAADCQTPSYRDVSPAPRSLRGRSEGELTLRSKGSDQRF